MSTSKGTTEATADSPIVSETATTTNNDKVDPSTLHPDLVVSSSKAYAGLFTKMRGT